MSTDPVISLSPHEAKEILAALAMFGGLLLGGAIEDDVLPNGGLRRLGIDSGPGAARALHARVEDLIQAIRRDLDRVV